MEQQGAGDVAFIKKLYERSFFEGLLPLLSHIIAVIRVKHMKNFMENPDLFDLICLLAVIFLLPLSISLVFKAQYLFSVLLLIISICAFMTLLGRIVIGPAYLEGHIVRFLIKHQGELAEVDLKKHYSQYGSMEFILNRLNQRDIIKIDKGLIELNKENINKGFRNNLMMWGTRKTKV